jgi:hypothetical protein
LGAQPYIGFCRESIALQDALDPSFPVFDLKKCQTKEDKIEYSDTHFEMYLSITIFYDQRSNFY